MLRMYGRLWQPATEGRVGRPWPYDRALAQVVSDARRAVGVTDGALPVLRIHDHGERERAWLPISIDPKSQRYAPPALTKDRDYMATVAGTSVHDPHLERAYSQAVARAATGDVDEERRLAAAQATAARSRLNADGWAVWCFGRVVGGVPAVLAAAGLEAEAHGLARSVAVGRDAPLITFARFLLAFGGERSDADRESRAARPLVDLFSPEHLPAVVRTCLEQGRVFVLRPRQTAEFALALATYQGAADLLASEADRIEGEDRSFTAADVGQLVRRLERDVRDRWLAATAAFEQNAGSRVYLQVAPDTDWREALADLERAEERGMVGARAQGRPRETTADLGPLLDAWPTWVACRLRGLTQDETAQRFDTSTATVKKRLLVIARAFGN